MIEPRKHATLLNKKKDERIAELESEVERLKAEVHECPECGMACKQCTCFEAELADCQRYRDAVLWLSEYASEHGHCWELSRLDGRFAAVMVRRDQETTIFGDSEIEALEGLLQQLKSNED